MRISAIKISIIVAVADNGVIGKDNDLPWRLSADLKHFKRLTMGHHLIVGRRTWESVGKPLPGRTFVVVTSRPGDDIDGLRFVTSIEAALKISASDDEVFFAGGRGIYEAALDVADYIYMTRVHSEPEGHAFFPEFDETKWRRVSAETHPADDRNEYAYSFVEYQRL